MKTKKEQEELVEATKKILGVKTIYEKVDIYTGIDNVLRSSYYRLKKPDINVYYDEKTDQVVIKKDD